MAKLNIQSQKNNPIEELSEIVTKKIFLWIKKEIVRYNSQEIMINDVTYRIGNYILNKKDSYWELRYFDNYVGRFLNKKHAMIFCFYHTRKDYNSARDVNDISEKMIYQVSDYLNFSHNFSKNSQNRDLYLARMKQNEKMINTLKKRISLHVSKISFMKRLGQQNGH